MLRVGVAGVSSFTNVLRSMSDDDIETYLRITRANRDEVRVQLGHLEVAIIEAVLEQNTREAIKDHG
jgi:hypothetical protein